MLMLDTNICIYIMRQRPERVLKRLQQVNPDHLCISVVTYAELLYGVERSASKKLNQSVLDAFIARLSVLSWEEGAARSYARLRRDLESVGMPIGNMDLMIAAHALSAKCRLVTNNLREFERVKTLKCLNWAG